MNLRLYFCIFVFINTRYIHIMNLRCWFPSLLFMIHLVMSISVNINTMYMYLRSFIWLTDLCRTQYCIGCTPSIIIIRFWKNELCIQSRWTSNYRNFLHNTFVDQFLNKILKKTWCKMLFYKNRLRVSILWTKSRGRSNFLLFESRFFCLKESWSKI